jgi:toxin ParE1/3/4
MRRHLRKDRAAEEDLVGIWLYSFENWGIAQADRYLSAIETGIGSLLNHPEKGRARDALRLGYWSTRLEHHVVFYTFNDDELRVRRVLHESMDMNKHL